MPLLLTAVNVAALPLGVLVLATGTNWFSILEHGAVLDVLVIWSLLSSASCFLTALFTGDCSQTDRLWSVSPVFYAGYMAIRASFSPIATLSFFLCLAWGIRLTFNFARRGGYTTMEDYRWEALRGKIRNPLLWQSFNLLFIAGFQNVLIAALVFPMALLETTTPVAALDVVLALCFLASLALETLADQQMWQFQEAKRRARENGAKWPLGNFIETGLWRYSRHPNIFFEALNWIIFYVFVSVHNGAMASWTCAGALVLVALLQGSLRFTENLSLARYPEYARRQAEVSAFLPLPKRAQQPESGAPTN